MNKWIKSKSNIKGMLAIIMALALLITGAFSLVSCGQDDQSSTSETSKESEFITESQPESEEQSSSQGGSEIESEAESSSEGATESESQSQSTESVTESETQSESTETTTESEQESETNSESETESESESTTESETESEIESESSTETESETESESDSESQNPTTVAEWVEANSNEINAFMNTNYLTTFAKKGFPIGFDVNKIQEATWILEGEDKITGIELSLRYKKGDTDEGVCLLTYTLSNPAEIKNFMSSPITIATTEVTREYLFQYNPTIQGTRDDLVNALFKAAGVNTVGGERYLKPLSQTAMIDGLGMAYGFTVVEVGENGIKEYTIYINVADNDAGYIAKLANSSEYKISGISKEIDISGAKVK